VVGPDFSVRISVRIRDLCSFVSCKCYSCKWCATATTRWRTEHFAFAAVVL